MDVLYVMIDISCNTKPTTWKLFPQLGFRVLLLDICEYLQNPKIVRNNKLKFLE